jgi:hypothetical protein
MLTLKQADRLAVQFKEKLQTLSIDKLARQSLFVRRTPRKITPINFLIGFFMVVLTGANALTALATTIGLLCGCRLSKQGVDKRIKAPALKFLELVLAATLATTAKDKNTPTYAIVFKAFKRVLVQDSTNVQLNPKLAKYFPGSRNQKKTKSAILKIQSVIDLVSERFCHFAITAFTQNDQKASPLILQLIQQGDLIIRDLGFLVLSVIKAIQLKGAFFLSRLKYGIVLYETDGETLFDLLAALQKYGRLDRDLCIGAKEKLRTRLVAIPVPEAVAAERRRKAKANRDRRLNPSKEHLALLGWEIFITNVGRDVLTAEQIAAFYELRWRIEIVFKSWKSHFSLKKVPQASAIRVQSYVYALLIFIAMFQTYVYARLYREQHEKNSQQISLLKLARFFKEHIWAVILFFQTLEEMTSQKVLEQIFYHCIYESRKDRLNYTEKVAALS